MPDPLAPLCVIVKLRSVQPPLQKLTSLGSGRSVHQAVDRKVPRRGIRDKLVRTRVPDPRPTTYIRHFACLLQDGALPQNLVLLIGIGLFGAFWGAFIAQFRFNLDCSTDNGCKSSAIVPFDKSGPLTLCVSTVALLLTISAGCMSFTVANSFSKIDKCISDKAFQNGAPTGSQQSGTKRRTSFTSRWPRTNAVHTQCAHTHCENTGCARAACLLLHRPSTNMLMRRHDVQHVDATWPCSHAVSSCLRLGLTGGLRSCAVVSCA